MKNYIIAYKDTRASAVHWKYIRVAITYTLYSSFGWINSFIVVYLFLLIGNGDLLSGYITLQINDKCMIGWGSSFEDFF